MLWYICKCFSVCLCLQCKQNIVKGKPRWATKVLPEFQDIFEETFLDEDSDVDRFEVFDPDNIMEEAKNRDTFVMVDG